MRANIKRKVYDTETSKLLQSKSEGEFGDARGYEEKLYLTGRGLYFIYGIGGADSPYPKERIKPLSKEEANAWGDAKSANKNANAGKKDKAKKSAQNKALKAKAPDKSATKKLPAKTAEPAVNIEVSMDIGAIEKV